jgi:hypothetical protein
MVQIDYQQVHYLKANSSAILDWTNNLLEQKSNQSSLSNIAMRIQTVLATLVLNIVVAAHWGRNYSMLVTQLEHPLDDIE